MTPIQLDEHSRLLYYQHGYTPDFVRRTLSSEGLDGLNVFAQLAEDIPSDLDFLRGFSFLTRLELTVMPREDFDYGFLSALENLEDLSVNVQLLPGVKTKPLDLAQLPKLKSLSLTWRHDIRGLAALTQLDSLRLVGYPAEDLRAIPAEIKLKCLMLKITSLHSLAGIEQQRELETLLLGACKRLGDLSGLGALPKLANLTLAGCPKVTDLDSLASLPSLKQLNLEDCPRLASIRPLAGLKLERLSLSGSTDIHDGDITPAAKVPDLRYRHRKHYNQRLPTPLADERSEASRRKVLDLWSRQSPRRG